MSSVLASPVYAIPGQLVPPSKPNKGAPSSRCLPQLVVPLTSMMPMDSLSRMPLERVPPPEHCFLTFGPVQVRLPLLICDSPPVLLLTRSIYMRHGEDTDRRTSSVLSRGRCWNED